MMNTIALTKKELYNGNLILVNERFPLSSLIENELIATDKQNKGILMAAEAVSFLLSIFRVMNCMEEIVPVSGYRSKKEQTQIYMDSLNENGEEFTKKYVALPNHSEHQTGLAIDLGLNKKDIDFIRPDFPYEGICDSFRKIAPKYGFIERYQKGKEVITGIAHEPWHFRYVGYPHSMIMEIYSFSLEEYMDFLKKYTYHGEHLKVTRGGQNIEIFYVPYDLEESKIIQIPDKSIYQISGNNADGYIITMWR